MTDQLARPEYASPGVRPNWRVRKRENPFFELAGLGLSLFLYSWIALFFIGLVTAAMSLFFGSWFLGFPNILAAIVLIPTLAAMAASLRRRRSAAVLGYLQQAVRLNLPLPRLLAAAAYSEQGRTRRTILSLKEELENGLPLGEALALAVPEMSMRTLGLIDYADQTGRLGETLNRLVTENVRHARRQRNDTAFAAWYPMLVIAMTCLLIAMLDIFVAPKFVQIFHDFRIPMPELFVLLRYTEDWVWLLVPLIFIGLLGALGWQLRQTLRITAPVWALRQWRDEIAWHLPVLGTPVRDRNTSDICVSMADSIALGYPLHTALERLGHLHLNTVMHRRVFAWADAMRAGMNPAEAARHARMPKLLTGLIATARDPAGMGEVLAFVGRFHTDRFLVRREAIRAAVIPVFTVTMGVIVALVALSIFIPLIRLTEKVAP